MCVVCQDWGGGYRVGNGVGNGVRSCVPCMWEVSLKFTWCVVYVVDYGVCIIEFDYVQ